MADLEDKKVSQLESGTVTSNSVFLDSGNGVSTKVGSQDVANFVGKTHAFSGSGGLNTTAKTLVGAINEVAGSAGKSNLADMDDVNIDDQTLAGGQGLVYDDTNDEWVNGDVASTLESLTDVDIDSTSLEDGQAIVYDETNDKWVNGTVSGGASVVQKTMAEYTALPTSEKMNGSIYKITDKALIYCLDEAYHAVKEITSADYALLTSDEKNNGTLYIITDEETTAADIPYSAGVSVADKLDILNDAFKIVVFNLASCTVDANSNKALRGNEFIDTTDIIPSGYSPMAFVGDYSTNNNIIFNKIECTQAGSTGVFVTLKNMTASNQTGYVQVKILYIKNSLL